MTSAETTPLRLLTVGEAATLLRQSRPTLYRKIERGQLRALRLGDHGPLRIPLDALTEHMRPVPEPTEQGERVA